MFFRGRIGGARDVGPAASARHAPGGMGIDNRLRPARLPCAYRSRNRILGYKLSIGALGEIRTPDPQIRSLVLYPAELRARVADPSLKSRRRGADGRCRRLCGVFLVGSDLFGNRRLPDRGRRLRQGFSGGVGSEAVDQGHGGRGRLRLEAGDQVDEHIARLRLRFRDGVEPARSGGTPPLAQVRARSAQASSASSG